ncbi:GNAT family N-acetyltransferase [Marinomonas sp. C2222]|uniref:GNAT family N-acetyltransferase n=1 Tax=Marinomonas sargassi TaxID=2984494 RepID=A0ABT2YQ30_9GAMM|nr:GNAT family N-acetyltransferase [Marinomonas sargassi]MCV2401988.1 GNAT family N-acetyltransferase [Marinomonas sargassi]
MIESVNNHNLDDILPLIKAYQGFYKIDNISDSKNRAFFEQFSETSSLGCQFLYRQEGKVVAFATVYFSYASSIISKVAVMNDVFTLEGYRSQGIARKLIEHCWQYAQANDAVRLQWVTSPKNSAAKRLYDSMKTNQSNWDFYTYSG